jgi:hypothetical protein
MGWLLLTLCIHLSMSNTRQQARRTIMSDREAFEKWWPSVGQTIGKVAAWEAWQAALQHSGEPVAWMSPNKQSLEFSRPDTVYGSHTIPLYASPQPVVPEGYVLVPVEPTEAMLMAWFSATRESSEGVGTLGYFRAAYKALLSAGKEDV